MKKRTRLALGTAATAAVALVGISGASPAMAEDNKTVVQGSRSSVAGICTQEGDIEWGTNASSGGYGCMFEEGGYIECNDDDQCVWSEPVERRGPTSSTGRPKSDVVEAASKDA
jgi:hypothetical protein